MADIAQALTAYLNADATVAALVGRRLYPSYDRSTDHVYPLAVYKFDISPVTAFDGPTGLTEAVLEIAAVATSYAGAVELGSAIYAALESQSGTWSGVVVQGVFVQDNGQRDEILTEPTTEEVLFYIKHFTFDVKFES